jgi:hypothetical protein
LKIEAKQEELNKLNEQLKGIKTEELPEDGYITMYQLFAKAINTAFAPKQRGKVTEKKPWTPEDIEFWFQMAISLFLEFAGIGCLIYSQYINTGEIMAPGKAATSTSQSSGIGFKPQKIVTAASKNSDEIQDEIQIRRLIGFQAPGLSSASASGTLRQKLEQAKSPETLSLTELKRPIEDSSHSSGNENPEAYAATKFEHNQKNNFELKKEDILQYLNYMYDSPKKEGYSRGVRTISKAIRMDEELARKIKGHLELKNIVLSEGINTKILCSRESALNKFQA